VQTYPVKRGHFKNIEGVRLKDMMEMSFGPTREEGAKYAASFGALERIVAWSDGKSLFVDTAMNPKVDDATAVATRERWNAFLEHATGYTAKQRQKKIQEEAKKGAPDVEA